MKRILCVVLLSLAGVAVASDPIAEFPNRVKRFTLKNGIRVLVMERPASETVSFATYIRTGGLDDEGGKTGLAHMFEHMLFKGTKTIGTKDYGKEVVILEQINQTQLDLQRELGTQPADRAKIAALNIKIAELNKRHEELLVPEEYWQIYERAGGRELNAATGYDYTNYTISLPLNAVKLWFVMEADRMRNPVLREFYKERSVVMEERRMRTDTSPTGKLWEAFLAAAFVAHPYGRPIVGWQSDISRVTVADAERFFKQHYDVSRLVVGVAGGVKAADIEKFCRTYFEPIPSQPAPDEARISIEPKQEGERRVQVEFDAEPYLMIGYHRPDMRHPDEAALSVLDQVLGSGRTSRLNRNVVEKKRIASSAWASGSTPGERDPNLFMLGGAPLAPRTLADLEKALYDELEALKTNGPTDAELKRVKNNIEASVIRGLASNNGLASQLAYYESVAGDWSYLLKTLREIRDVTAADVKRVATQYLIPSNRTVATLTRKKP